MTLILLLASWAWGSCQDVEEPVYNVPTVTTDAVEKMTGTWAYLSGSVSAYAIRYYFLISTSEDLSEAEELSADYYIDDDKYYCQCETGNLQPGTTYYYTLCATDGRSEVRGSILSFTTAAYLGIESVSLNEWDEENEQTGFVPDGELGIYVYYDQGDGIYHPYENISAVYSDSVWKLSRDISFPEQDLTIHAYWPYTTLVDGNLIPVKAESDVLFGTSETLNASHPNAHIRMHHAMSRVTFAITKTEGNPLDDTVTRIRLANRTNDGTVKAIALEGYMSAFSGEVHHRDQYTHDGIFQNCQFVPEVETPHQVSMTVLPSSFGEDEAILELFMDNGYSITAALPADKWEAGMSYTYTLHVSVTDLVVTDVRVEEWINNEGGNITITQ